MATSTRISELPQATTVNTTDKVIIENSTTTQYTTVDKLVSSATSDVEMYTFAQNLMSSVSSGRVFIKREKTLGVVTIFGNLNSSTTVGAWIAFNVITLLGTAYTPRGTRSNVSKLGGYSTTTAGGVEIRNDGGFRVFTTTANQQIDFLLIYETSAAVYTSL